MSREYKHIQGYEKEILTLVEQGKTQREIGGQLGLTKEKVKGFIHRYHCKQRKLETGMVIHKKGRPPKNHTVAEQDKLSELRYILARKEAKIKQLEMENELMRDFLSLTERK